MIIITNIIDDVTRYIGRTKFNIHVLFNLFKILTIIDKNNMSFINMVVYAETRSRLIMKLYLYPNINTIFVKITPFKIEFAGHKSWKTKFNWRDYSDEKFIKKYKNLSKQKITITIKTG